MCYTVFVLQTFFPFLFCKHCNLSYYLYPFLSLLLKCGGGKRQEEQDASITGLKHYRANHDEDLSVQLRCLDAKLLSFVNSSSQLHDLYREGRASFVTSVEQRLVRNPKYTHPSRENKIRLNFSTFKVFPLSFQKYIFQHPPFRKRIKVSRYIGVVT